MELSFKLTKRRMLAVLAVLALLVTAAAAYAAWTTSGTGDAKAKTGKLNALVVILGGTPVGTAFPGDAMDVSFVANNTNAKALTLTTVDATTATVTTNKVGCVAADFTTTVASGLNIPLPATTMTNVLAQGVLTLKASAPTECQDAIVTLTGITVTAST